MIAYSNFHFYWVVFEIINGTLISILSGIDIFVLIKHRKDNAPLVSWALNIKESKNNFSLLISAACLFIVIFALYSYGSVSGSDLIKEAAELLGTITYLIASYVIFDWSRTFARFV